MNSKLFASNLIGSIFCIFHEIYSELNVIIGEPNGRKLVGAGNIIEINFAERKIIRMDEWCT